MWSHCSVSSQHLSTTGYPSVKGFSCVQATAAGFQVTFLTALPGKLVCLGRQEGDPSPSSTCLQWGQLKVQVAEGWRSNSVARPVIHTKCEGRGTSGSPLSEGSPLDKNHTQDLPGCCQERKRWPFPRRLGFHSCSAGWIRAQPDASSSQLFLGIFKMEHRGLLGSAPSNRSTLDGNARSSPLCPPHSLLDV